MCLVRKHDEWMSVVYTSKKKIMSLFILTSLVQVGTFIAIIVCVQYVYLSCHMMLLEPLCSHCPHLSFSISLISQNILAYRLSYEHQQNAFY